MATLGGQLTRSAASYADQTALIFGEHTRSYQKLNEEVNQHELDETFGEKIVAVVTPIPGCEPNLDDLRTFAASYVSDYKLPRELVIRAIPRNPSGKILKHVLRDQIRSHEPTTLTDSGEPSS